MKRSGIINKIRNSFYTKCFALFVGLNIIFQMISPTLALALTSGPGQPEFSSFEPASTTDMVDLYSGDFTYNIPLLTVPGPNGGYPINIAYHSGVGMDEEASWVGLGWNLNVGAINRQLRGVPDDFNGEVVTQKFHTRPDRTLGFDLSVRDNELFGFPDPSAPPSSDAAPLGPCKQIYFNSFRGLGYRLIANFGKSIQSVNAGLNISIDPQSGIGITPSIGVGAAHGLLNSTLSANINNRNGLSSMNFITKINEVKISGDADNKANGSYSLGSSPLSFGVNQSVPEVNMPVSSFSIPFVFEIGSATTFGKFEAETGNTTAWSGYYNQSKVKGNGEVNKSAFGYLNEQNNDGTSMIDYNKSNIPYSKKTPNLAPSNFTYDIFNLTGQGIGGMFRAQRSDVNLLHITQQKQTSNTTDLGFEFGKTTGTPTNIHVGVDVKLNHGESTSGIWEDGTYTDLETGLTATGSATYEPAYFKIFGERGGDYYNDDHLKAWYGDEAIRVKIDKTSGWPNKEFIASDEFIESQTSTSPAVTANSAMAQKPTRQKRLKVIEALNETEAGNFGFDKSLKYYAANGTTEVSKPFNRSSGNHISEVSIFQEDGMRYTYGLPAYNLSQVDVNMSVKNQTTTTNTLKVNLTSNGQDYLNNTSSGGKTNQFLNKTELPAYVHSWMLTSVVASDYVDIGDPGPSDEDFGYWVKFNYIKKLDNYKWRVPYQGASFSEGNKTDALDNTAYYTYGEKELFYVQEIETKTHIAVFYLSEREDALSAYDEYALYDDGVASPEKGTQKQFKLDKISLYVKADYLANPTTAIPIQSVHFKYSYELCRDVPNNTLNGIDEDGNTVTPGSTTDVNKWHGKLTLKKIYFTYQNSTRGSLSPYVFDYGTRWQTGETPDDGFAVGDIKKIYNPYYEAMDVDRWGNFKNNSENYSNDRYPYTTYTYTEQNEIWNGDFYESGENVGQWSLRKIDLPTGGTINVNYESDDYAYVEDKPAMQVFDIVGTDTYNSSAYRDNTTETIENIDNSTMVNSLFRIYFKLDRLYPSDADEADFKRDFLKDITKIWYKTEIDLKDFGDYENVSGYAEISNVNGSYGLARTAGGATDPYDLGYISLKPVNVNSTLSTVVHPFRKAAWQYMKLHRPEIINNAVVPDGSLVSMIGSLFNAVFNPGGDVFTMLVGGYYQACMVKDYSENIKLNGKSVIRLYEPDGKKYGGGVRVKKISLDDNWIAAGDQSSYGQDYFYDTNGDGTGKSTGVAYEPSVGAEESSLRQPIEYGESTLLGSSYSLFLETPLMEQFYPGPSVGYSKVTVKSIAPSEASSHSATIENTASPISVYEFYTAKDFPVLFDQTDMNSDPAIVRPLMIPGVYTSMKMRRARSQGYSIVLNDMAGKPKSIASYKRFPENNSTQSLISKTEYVYRTEQPYNPNIKNKLNNVVQVLNNENEYQTAVLGQTFDVMVDLNENKDLSYGGGVEFNFEATSSVPPLFFLMPIPTIDYSETSMKTSVTSKIIHRSGIIKEVIVTTDQSKISTENLAYDINTGEPILTKVNNEFKDAVYSLNLPAYWYYDLMGSAYKNIGTTISGLTCSSVGVVSGFGSTNVEDVFVEGDEVYTSVGNICHVAEVDDISNTIILMKQDGNYHPSSSISVQIRKSGRRNLMGSMAGNIVAKSLSGLDNTIKTSATAFSFDKIIDANAIEYSDNWQTICGSLCNDITNESGDGKNPFMNGIKGNWRPKRNYKFITDRLNASNAREDGVYAAFVLFNWGDPSSADNRWIAASTITKYSPYGYELENKDALGIFSSAIYGYGQSLVKAIAQNARYGEVLSEGFEDYDMLTCNDTYFYFGSGLPTSVTFGTGVALVNTMAHTGKYSLEMTSSASSVTSSSHIVSDLSSCDSYVPQYGITKGESTYYEIQPCDCVGDFNLQPNTSYVISAWVKEVGTGPFTTYAIPQITVSYTGTGSPPSESFVASGEIIEGWQRIYQVFTVPSGATGMTISLERTSSGNTIYFDDIRIQPNLSNMVAYVYNPITLKLEAELDANNYATFYIYDEAGHLNKVKKETIKGIKTIKEGRISNVITQ